MVQVEASRINEAAVLAKQKFSTWREDGYRLVRVDHISDDGNLVIDW